MRMLQADRAISAFWKIHSCKFILIWTRNRMITYTNCFHVDRCLIVCLSEERYHPWFRKLNLWHHVTNILIPPKASQANLSRHAYFFGSTAEKITKLSQLLSYFTGHFNEGLYSRHRLQTPEDESVWYKCISDISKVNFPFLCYLLFSFFQ